MKIKTKKLICLTICFVCFMAMLGAMGSVELGTMSIERGAIIALVSLTVGYAAGYKGGYIKTNRGRA